MLPELLERDHVRAAARYTKSRETSPSGGPSRDPAEIHLVQTSAPSGGTSAENAILTQRMTDLASELLTAAAFVRHKEWLPRLVGKFRGQTALGRLLTRDLALLARRVAELFEEEPVEAGQTHPAEELLAAALDEESVTARIWLAKLSASLEREPRAGLLRCLGRLPADRAQSIAMPLIEQALRSELLLERGAAVRALEAWGTPGAAEILRSHADTETDPWLADYAQRVAASLP